MRRIKKTALVLVVCVIFVNLVSCAKTVTVMEYSGEKISVNMYSYWLSQIKSSYVSSSNDTEEYWNTTYSNGQTYEEKMREIVDFNVKVNLVCQKLFKDMDLSVSDENQAEMEQGLNDLIVSYGSKSELNSMLANYNVNYNILKDIYEIELRTTAVYDSLYAEGGLREIDDETLDKYFRENYSCLDIILIYNNAVYEKDENGELIYDETTGTFKTRELTDDEVKAKNALAEDIINKLESGENFDNLKKLYNEDPQSNKFADGYYMSSNDLSVYGSELVLASQEMKIGDFRKIDDGQVICIVKRKELSDKPYTQENYIDQFSSLMDYCEQADFNEYMDTLVKDVVVYEEEISDISVRDAALMGY